MARQSHKKIGHSLDHPSMAVYRQALEHYSRTGSWPSLGRSGKLPEIVRKEKERIAKTLTETRAKNSILNFFPKSRLGEQVVSSPSTADTNEVTLTTDDSGTSKGTTPQRKGLDTGAVEYVRHLLMNNGSITQGAAYLTSALDKAYSVRLRAYEEKSLGGYREIWCSVSPLRDLSMERDHLLRELAAHGAKTSILKWRRRMDLLPGLGLKVPDESLTPRSVEALGPSVVQERYEDFRLAPVDYELPKLGYEYCLSLDDLPVDLEEARKSDPGSATCFLEMLDKIENGEGGEDDVEAIEKDAEDGSSDGSADDADALPMASDVMRDGAIDDPPGIAPARASGDLAKRIRLKAASSTPDNYPVLHEVNSEMSRIFSKLRLEFPKASAALLRHKYMEEYFYIEKEAHKQERRQPRALHPISVLQVEQWLSRDRKEMNFAAKHGSMTLDSREQFNRLDFALRPQRIAAASLGEVAMPKEAGLDPGPRKIGAEDLESELQRKRKKRKKRSYNSHIYDEKHKFGRCPLSKEGDIGAKEKKEAEVARLEKTELEIRANLAGAVVLDPDAPGRRCPRCGRAYASSVERGGKVYAHRQFKVLKEDESGYSQRRWCPLLDGLESLRELEEVQKARQRERWRKENDRRKAIPPFPPLRAHFSPSPSSGGSR
ncbi:hypothetical protein FOZ60_010998 [Perkinsus olseni]|uniref:Uncharacterized protein n=1 Tax=Perkinsus olseni TaxID=32597 RepID=A0A7J6NE56_PEROL|nr:hypothetical protein FOZ60_010998 [Perkinsus olseni]